MGRLKVFHWLLTSSGVFSSVHRQTHIQWCVLPRCAGTDRLTSSGVFSSLCVSRHRLTSSGVSSSLCVQAQTDSHPVVCSSGTDSHPVVCSPRCVCRHRQTHIQWCVLLGVQTQTHIQWCVLLGVCRHRPQTACLSSPCLLQRASPSESQLSVGLF